VGVGHFEPLRHYAEVHLLLEPDELGSGLSFDTNCSEDILDRNWQRLVLTHLEEKEHVGVLTGSPITDMKITLIAGRAHQKHTEGGDFRQATYRAVRQGLKRAQSILLEPYYNFRMEIPSETVGRAMSDIVRMSGSFNPPEVSEDISIVNGVAPVATMMGYQSEVTAYTKGRGRLFCTMRGYLPCHNSDEVIQTRNYDSERDPYNPTGSVFCAHGAGFVVEWDKVQSYMHLDSLWDQPAMEEVEEVIKELPIAPKSRGSYGGSLQEDKELEAIFTSTYGPMKRKLAYSSSGLGYEKRANVDKTIIKQQTEEKKKDPVKEYLLVDGYNVIFSWEELNELAKVNLDAARSKLMDILCNYQGFKKCILILVFDAYKVKGGLGEVFDYHNIHVVYTKEAETADEYIEKVTHEMARHHHVTVATSDALEQLIILGQGAIRFSANDLKKEITRVRDQIRRDYLEKQPSGRAFFKDQFDDILGQFESFNNGEEGI
jgi:predicted RNA-binding protein with PIN domain